MSDDDRAKPSEESHGESPRSSAGARRSKKSKSGKPARAKKKSLRELNAWMTKNHDELVRLAEENTRKLTGRSHI
jgi:hypothetical protein